MSSTRFTLASVGLGVAAMLSACGGGGGGGGDSTPAPAPVVQKASVPVRVVDGAIRNARVCLDKNANSACDADEPSGTTDASGNVTLSVDPADVGKYPVLAIVGTDAVDADNGPVTTAFLLKAPASQTAVVSPLTTLVQSMVETTGATATAAEQTLRSQVGVNVSLFSDFTSGSTANATLATIARLLVVTNQEQTNQLAAAVGTTGVDGKVITATDLQTVIQQKLVEILPTLASNVSDIQSGTPVTTVAQQLVADSGFTTTSIQTAVAISRSSETTNDAPTAGGSTTAITWTNAQNWFRRVLVQSTADATPDSNGLTRYMDRRYRSASGALSVWGSGNEPARHTDVHFNGTSWGTCGMSTKGTSTVRDAQGRSQYSYCDNREAGATQRTTVDVSGRLMKDVYNEAHAAGLTNLSIANSDATLGSATFPTGSKVFYQTTTPLTTAFVYLPGLTNDVKNVVPEIYAAGATCGTLSNQAASTYTSMATTLESMTTAHPGTPCVFAPQTVTGTSGATLTSGPRNEWWTQTTVHMSTLGNAATTAQPVSSFYTGNTVYRIAFGANKTTKFYQCQERWDGSVRNCDSIGTGTYSISTVGDARVLTFDNEPTQFLQFTFQRIFVERGGKVHYGFKSRPTPNTQARLNLAATNAISTVLGMPQVHPDAPDGPTLTSFQGEWLFSDQPVLDLLITDGTLLRVSATTGALSCADNPSGAAATCTGTLNPSTGALTLTFPDGVATATLNFDTGTATGTFTPTTGAPVAIKGQRTRP